MCGFICGLKVAGQQTDALASRQVPGSSIFPLPQLMAAFHSIQHRGPDQSRIEMGNGYFFGFHRLAIMDRSPDGMQPFLSKDGSRLLACNGEIYNDRALRESLQDSHVFLSGSDCEVLLPLIEKLGFEDAVRSLDGEFAFVAYDQAGGRIMAARDPLGIRPLFYGFAGNEGGGGEIMYFASEAKALHDLCHDVRPFPPGFLFDGQSFKQYRGYGDLASLPLKEVSSELLAGIRERLVDGVTKRLQSDVPVGFLLSGGLDSSLVCSIASRLSDKPIHTFAIGTAIDAIDLKYARQVAEHIGSIHHEVMFSRDDVLRVLPDVVRHLESWDITTVRASVGMYLVCEWIRKNTPCRVLLSGEVSDELFGYKYTDFAPDAAAFQAEAEKRIRELYMYDVLRADRCIAAHGLEARVPFSDQDFVEYVMRIPAELKMNRNGIGKYLLRQAFAEGDYLPRPLLMREKAAFSDAVGHSMVDDLKAFAEDLFSEHDLAQAAREYAHCPPISKESLWYRRLFESFYPGRSELVAAYWMPNREWQNCDVSDPSARVLPNYGFSGK